MRRYRYQQNFRVYTLVIFLKGEDEPITECFYSIKDVVHALEEYEKNPDFSSAHLSIEG